MKRNGKRNGQTKVLQRTAQKPAESKGLDFAKAQVPVKRSGTALIVASAKTREQLCDELCCDVAQATGTSLEVADRIVEQMIHAAVWPQVPSETDGTERLIKAIARIAEYNPQNVQEADLAVQMTATNEAALLFMRRAAVERDADLVDRAAANATRFSRLYLQQLEAMQKLKGKAGQQKVTVEHVHVYKGGQAIVGSVERPAGTPGEGGGR